MSEAELRPGPQPGDVDGPPRIVRRSTLHTMPAAMTLYAALAGREPRIDPTLADPLVRATLAVRADPFSPTVVGAYVRQLVRAHRHKLNRPELAAWVRRQSAVVKRRLAETKGRVAAGTVKKTSAECKVQNAE